MTRFWLALATIQARHPWRVLLAALLVVLFSGFLASHLTVQGGFEHLLPDGAKSVVELNRVGKRTAGVSTLFVVLELPKDQEPDREALRKASNATVEEVRKVGEPWVGTAENGVQEAVKFFETRAGLYANADELEKLSNEVEARYKWEGAKAAGSLLDENEPPPPLDVSPESIKKRFGVEGGASERYPDGYFESPDGRVHVIAIRSKVLGGDLVAGNEAIDKVRAAVARVNLDQYQKGIKVGLAGDLYTGVAEVTAINKDVSEVGLIGGLLIAGIMFVYYLRFRTLLIMSMNIVIGLMCTAGLSWILVHKLNTGTSFVFTILAGNGINAGIIYMARYLEARRKGEGVESAIGTSHVETWTATLCAAAASAASFLSLYLTSFRGFRELGLIGGVGLFVCWVTTVLTLPAFLAVFEKWKPFVDDEGAGFFGRLRRGWASSFGKPFAFVITRAPRAITIGGLALAVGGYFALYLYVKSDPYEYDMNNLRNDPKTRAEEERVKKLSDSITGYVGADGMAILVDRVDQVAPLRAELEKRRDASTDPIKPFKSVIALEDFVPKEQDRKIPILLQLKKRMTKAHSRGAIKDADWAQVERYLPPDELAPITMDTIPESVARTFTEVDGTRGRIVFIEPTSPSLTEDARYLLRWADSYRETPLPDGSVIVGSGRAVIYADMWEAVIRAVPQAVIASFLAVVAVVLLAFRRGRATAMVIAALLVGIGWMALGLLLARARLNFLNFVALPITFGIGVEYAVNVVWRATREGPGGALTAVRETGGAVVLCSMTTTLGYLALIGSMNFAVKSLGTAAVIGEVTTLLAAMLVLPAALVWMEQRRGKNPISATVEARTSDPVPSSSSVESAE
ncbi:MAG TPA: MMPL family transporter [Polyangiaceae bacterium]|nr:MMPL family transporter [Polyangiaceae bacterium]